MDILKSTRAGCRFFVRFVMTMEHGVSMLKEAGNENAAGGMWNAEKKKTSITFNL
jgi:hypothetical protein